MARAISVVESLTPEAVMLTECDWTLGHRTEVSSA